MGPPSRVLPRRRRRRCQWASSSEGAAAARPGGLRRHRVRFRHTPDGVHVADTIPARLFAQAEKRPGSPAYFEKVDGSFRPVSWSEYTLSVRRAARALISGGLEPGPHGPLLGFHRPRRGTLD